MNESNNTEQAAAAKPRLGRRWIIAALLVGVTGLAGASYASEGFGMHGRCHGHHANMDPASAAKHIDRMIERVAPDGTPQQKARLADIAKAVHADLQPVHGQFKTAHQQAHDLLMQPSIDRVALEQLRVQQVQRVDTVSKRILTAVEDAAEVLTPEQRVRFAEHMKKRMH